LRCRNDNPSVKNQKIFDSSPTRGAKARCARCRPVRGDTFIKINYNLNGYV
jgi:hypothetical protein